MERSPSMTKSRRVVALVTCAIFLLGCLLLGPLALLGVLQDAYSGEIFFHRTVHGPIYHRWDTQPVAFVATVVMWLTVTLLLFIGIRPLFRQMKKIWRREIT